MGSTVDSDREERFKHLLQPIRDLAQNWDVDIATSLEDYLEDLEDITITLDGGASKVNFAEAALLIQGSTCVYSRKVEHVYQLVLRTIDFLTQQKRLREADASKSKSGGDDDLSGGEDAEFLPLDDILEGKHIDMAGAPTGRGRATNHRYSYIAQDDALRVGLQADPQADDKEDGGWTADGDVPEITRPPMFLMEQDYGNSFKMSTCAPQQQSGTLLIDGSSLQESSGGSFSLVAPLNGGTGETARACDFWRGLGREGGEGGRLELPADSERWAGGMGNSDVDDSDGGGEDFAVGFGGPEDGLDESRGANDVVGAPHTPMASMPGGRELRPRAPREESEPEPQRDVRPMGAADPWAGVDPHDPGTTQARPIRKGRTYRLPPQLRRCRRSKTNRHTCIEGAGGASELRDHCRSSWVGDSGRLMLSVPLLGLAYPEFQYISNRERQRKAAQTRLARRQARVFMGREEFQPETLASNPAQGGDASAVDGMGVYDGYGSDGSYGSGGGGRAGVLGDMGTLSDDDEGGDGQSHGVRESAGNAGNGVGPISLEDAFRNKPQTYEDLCRTHIEAFMRGTEKYAHETQLSKRVGAWQEKLEPLMESQEKRQAFDIHAYGQSVLSRVASVLTPEQRAKANTAVKGGDTQVDETAEIFASAGSKQDSKQPEPGRPLVDFGVVVAGKEHFDVCRLFLASLQLANNGNVRLFHGRNAAEQETTPFRLELLSMKNSDNMSGCFAPTGGGLDSAPDDGAKNRTTAKNTATHSVLQSGAACKAKVKSRSKKGGRSGVVGTKNRPYVS